MSATVKCSVCNKDFTARRYYKQHFAYPKNLKCKLALAGKSSSVLCSLPFGTNKRQYDQVDDPDTEDVTDHSDQSGDSDCDRQAKIRCILSKLSEYDGGFGVFGGNNSDSEDSSQQSDSEAANPDDDTQDPVQPNTEMLANFQQYIAHAQQHHGSLPVTLRAGISLLDLLQRKRAPLTLFNELFAWHVEHEKAKKACTRQNLITKLSERYNMNGCRPFEKDLVLPYSQSCIKLVCHSFIDQVQSLLSDPRWEDKDYLFHNDDPSCPPPEPWAHLSDINTGQSYRETYKEKISDLQNEVLLPVIFYMDGAVCGQFKNLPIEQLKFTLGIFNAEAREKEHAWRTLGYVAHHLAEDSQATEQITTSNHVDSQNYLDSVLPDEPYAREEEAADNEEEQANDSEHQSEDDEEDEEESSTDDQDLGQDTEDSKDNTDDATNASKEDEQSTQSDAESGVSEDEILPNAEENQEDEPVLPAKAAQDLHAMLQAMLESYREIQEAGGFYWDIHYKGTTRRYRFIPYVMMIKGDSVEHDKHCGHYSARTKNIREVCRYCHAKTKDLGNAYGEFVRRTQEEIQNLIDAEDWEELKEISQQIIQNAWYELNFGVNEHGIHGACPLELLHWFNLGLYKYIRQMFFDQIGEKSKLAKKINMMAKTMGKFYKRQSDRTLPRTTFNRGIVKGKLMAHEYTGLILVLLSVLRSKEGYDALKEMGPLKKKFGPQICFKKDSHIQNWILMLETLLEWEEWLKKPELSVREVKRCRKKFREIMELMKLVGARTKGMGFNIQCFHATVHVPDDILMFGVPRNVNTKSDESHHKTSKSAALKTQKRAEMFDLQTANQMFDVFRVRLQQ